MLSAAFRQRSGRRRPRATRRELRVWQAPVCESSWRFLPYGHRDYVGFGRMTRGAVRAGQPRGLLVWSGVSMGGKYFGASVRRKEDPRFLRGEGRYVGDIKLPGLLHAAFVRSPHGHAKVLSVKTEAARRLAGVTHVFAFADLERWMKPLPLFGGIPPGLAARVVVKMKQVAKLAMARDRVRFVGEIVAMVVASSRALAEDGCELVEVEYEPLPVVADMVAGAEPGAHVLHPEWGDNVAVVFEAGFGDPGGAFAQ